MTRIIFSSLAIVAMFATSAAPAAGQAGLSGQQPVPCDRTNRSAEHCPEPSGSSSVPPAIPQGPVQMHDSSMPPGHLLSIAKPKPQIEKTGVIWSLAPWPRRC